MVQSTISWSYQIFLHLSLMSRIIKLTDALIAQWPLHVHKPATMETLSLSKFIGDSWQLKRIWCLLYIADTMPEIQCGKFTQVWGKQDCHSVHASLIILHTSQLTLWIDVACIHKPLSFRQVPFPVFLVLWNA